MYKIPRNLIMGPWNVRMGPCNVNGGPWNVIREPVMSLWDSGM